MMPIEKTRLQALAEIRLQEAETLMKCYLPSGAFHLAGIALELALKACIAAQFERHIVPDKSLITEFYSHDLGQLLKTAGLLPKLRQASEALQRNWETAKTWTIESRYAMTAPEHAEAAMMAISDPSDGAFTWIKTHW